MGKSTQRCGKRNTGTSTHSRISWKACRETLRATLAKSRKACQREPAPAHKLQLLLKEESLECPVCLQTLLWPVLAECGHLFCLTCAEQLARHNYACGMCHSFEASFDLRVDSRFQELVRTFLEGCDRSERLNYEQRQKALQEKEASRRPSELSAGDLVDFWSTQEKAWRAALVSQVTKDGQVTLRDPKTSAHICFSIESRRIARHRHYTKEELVLVVEDEEDAPETPVQARPAMFGMPFFINFFGNHDPAPLNFDMNDIFGFGIRPFPF